VGQERLGPSYFFISLVLGPLNSLVWYVPSLRYTRGLGWRMHCGVEVIGGSTLKVLLASFDSCLSVLQGYHVLLIHECRMIIGFLLPVLVLAHTSELANHCLM
jgi:hypothetical protein